MLFTTSYGGLQEKSLNISNVYSSCSFTAATKYSWEYLQLLSRFFCYSKLICLFGFWVENSFATEKLNMQAFTAEYRKSFLPHLTFRSSIQGEPEQFLQFLSRFSFVTTFHVMSVLLKIWDRETMSMASRLIYTNLQMKRRMFYRIPSCSGCRWKVRIIHPVTVFDAILTSTQNAWEITVFMMRRPMSNNFRKTAVLKNNLNCKLKLHSKGFY